MKRWFVTGTDTGVGKTRAACALIRHLAGSGQSVAAMKPVASGCVPTTEGLRNDDALALMDAMNVELDYTRVNPFAYEPAIAPHLAAQAAGRPIDVERIVVAADSITADHLVIEGAGGWCVPLNDRQLFPELVGQLKADVILVVGMKLGCINHALLSARQIQREGFNLVGWIANTVDPDMPFFAENLRTVAALMPAPLLAEIAWESTHLSFADKKCAIFDKSELFY